MGVRSLSLLPLMAFGLAASVLNAATISLENRTDFMIETYDGILEKNKESDSLQNPWVGKSANYGFNFQRIRLNFAGKTPYAVDYRVRMRFDNLLGPQLAYTTNSVSKTSADGKTVTTTSTTTAAPKRIGGIALLEGALDLACLGDDVSGSAVGLSGGLEYYPEKDAKYRYHLIAADRISMPENLVSDSDRNVTHQMKLFLGVLCNLDIIKIQ